MPHSSRPEALVFDVGEVLLRLDFSRLFATLKLAKGVGVGPAMDALGRWELYDAFERGHFPEDEFRRRIEESLGRAFEPEPFRELWNSVIVGAVPGVERLLEGLATQVPLYGLTNSNEIHMRHVRSTYPWLERLTALYSSHELGARKPERGIYEDVARRIGKPPERLLFVDDRAENVEGARAAGYRAELVRTSPDDLLDILRRYGFRG